MPVSKSAKFLMKLGEDPALAQKFRTDPLGTMTRAQLSDAEKHIILSGNASKIGQLVKPGITAAGGGDNTVVVVVVVVV